jgi:hypothetical protein
MPEEYTIMITSWPMTDAHMEIIRKLVYRQIINVQIIPNTEQNRN